MSIALLEKTLAIARRDAWVRGDLSYKLQAHQLPVYAKYRAWEQRPTTAGAGKRRRIFVMDIGRQWGKTSLVLLIKLEDALRRPGSRHTFATAYAKDIADILIPLADMFSADAPDNCRPVFQRSKSGQSQGLFFPKNGPARGSVIKLVGVDLHPRALRGRASDGMAFTEAGYVRGLDTTVMDVCYPQFQRRPHARMILESNAPEAVDHDFDVQFVPDAKERDAYVFGTIDDNTAMDDATKQEFIDAAGGRESPRCQREYFGIRIRDPERTVVPEYDEQRHVRRIERPPYAVGCFAQDPGHRDLFGIVWGYWHFELQMLVILRSWAKRNAGTAEVAQVILDTNAELFDQPGHELRWWDGPQEKTNPAVNVSDVDPRLLRDLNVEYDLHVRAADKSKNGYGIGESRLYKLRNGFRFDQIAIDPDDPGPLRDHVRKAMWNDKRTDLQRHPVYGHFDCMMALLYLFGGLGRWRNVNPTRPPAIFTGLEADVVFGPNYRPAISRAERERAALFGDKTIMAKHPAPGLVKPQRTPLSRCPVCSRWRRCELWNESGMYVCGQECSDKWTYRATGGKPPALPAPPVAEVAELPADAQPALESELAVLPSTETAGIVYLKPHNEAPEALAALDATLTALIGGGPLERDAAGAYARNSSGWYRAKCANAAFAAWACKQQGYARAAKLG